MDTKRFHNPQYKSQIQAARNYKRQARVRPEGRLQAVLYHLGLGSWKNRAIAVLILGLLVYLIYFAGFLKVKGIDVTGADLNVTAQVQNEFNSFIRGRVGLVFPESNILFFSKSKFTQYLLSSNYGVASVTGIKKHLFGGISLQISQRFPLYVLEIASQQTQAVPTQQSAPAAPVNSNKTSGTPGKPASVQQQPSAVPMNYYILNSDSTIGSQITADQIGQLIPLVDTAQDQIKPGDKFLNGGQNDFLNYINSNANPKLSLDVVSYQVPGRASNQLIVYFKQGFKVLFNSSTDPQEYLGRLQKIWLQLSQQQQSTLVYLDLRFENNAYACYKGSPCATGN
ncbi:hypothetical protein KGQ24_00795 [Patescibacteria group bacterium]|nr:hypothetical protein [Patescibacteria group bacterium]